MILDCPSCRARYLVAAAHFADGSRRVRCARCTHIWLADVPTDAATRLAETLTTPTDSPAPEMPPADGVAPQPVPPDSALPAVVQPYLQLLRRWMGWMVAGAVLAFIVSFLACFVLYREELAKSWPKLEPVYERLGLHIYHVGEGMRLADVHSEMRFVDGTTQLVVEGAIVNETAEDTLKVPDLMASAVGADGNVMQSWRIEPPARTVEAKSRVPFRSALRITRGTVLEVNLSFVEPLPPPPKYVPPPADTESSSKSKSESSSKHH